MEQEIKTVLEAQGRAWEEFKRTNDERIAAESKGHETRAKELDVKLDKVNAFLNAQQEILNDLQAKAKATLHTASEKASEAKTQFLAWLRKGATPETKALSVGDNSAGGYWAPPEFAMEIVKAIVDVSNVRPFVRVRSTSNRSVQVPKRTGTFSAAWVGELATRSETTGYATGLEEIPAHELYALVDISNQELEDAAFNMEAELRQEFAEQFGYAEGVAVISGSGTKQPEGILTNASVSYVAGGSASAVTYSGLVDALHGLKAGYAMNASVAMNWKTLGAVRKLVDSQNLPVFWPAVSAANPATILGRPLAIWAGLPDVAANAYPVVAGDFQRAYTLVDRVGIEITRDPLTQAAAGLTRFIARKRLGGQIVNAEAVLKLKIATS